MISAVTRRFDFRLRFAGAGVTEAESDHSPLTFSRQAAGKKVRVIVAASTVAVVAIAVVVIVALLALVYILPRGGRRRR
jgi:hypothetical protein